MLAVAYYIEFLAPDGQRLTPTGVRNYQNFFIAETRTWQSTPYLYAPFVVSGDLSTEGGTNGEAEILAPANMLSGAVFWEAAYDRFLVRVETILLAGTAPAAADGVVTWTEQAAVACDVWCCDGMSYTDDIPGEESGLATMILRLTSPFNAVSGNAPTRRLRDDQVGALPATGGIAI